MPRRPAVSADPARRGVVLILTLFVILITYALVAQLTLGTSVASQTTRNAALRIQMRAACTSAAQQILDTLSEDASGGLAGAAEELAGAGGGFGGLGGEQPAGGEEGEEGAGEEGNDADSFEDAWARTMRIVLGEVEILAFVQDENGKFNLLTMLSEDEEQARLARDRCQNILDRLRTDFDDDLDRSEAGQVRDEILAWLEGRDRDEDYPRPPRYSDPEEGDYALPSSLEELMILERVGPELYYDQVRDDDRYAPGLESVFTVLTSIDFAVPEAGELDEEEGEEGAEGGDPAGAAAQAAAAAQGAMGGEDPTGEEEVAAPVTGGLLGAAEGDPPLGVKINLNTAPRPVLEGLLLDGPFPRDLAEEVLEYRNEVDEEALEERESEEYDAELAELERSFYGEEEPEPKLIFASLEDLDKLEGFAAMESTLQQEFRDTFDVKSDIYSVHLFARVPPVDWMQEERYQEAPGPVLRLRAIFWRRNTDDGVKFIPVLPWHEVPFMRWRLPDFPDRLPVYEPPRY